MCTSSESDDDDIVDVKATTKGVAAEGKLEVDEAAGFRDHDADFTMCSPSLMEHDSAELLVVDSQTIVDEAHKGAIGFGRMLGDGLLGQEMMMSDIVDEMDVLGDIQADAGLGFVVTPQ